MKIKYIFILVFLFFVPFAFSHSKYKIVGTWENADGKVVYLKKSLGDRQYQTIDSAVVQNGKFILHNTFEYIDEMNLDINGTIYPFILEENEITVVCTNVEKEVRGNMINQVQTEITGSDEQKIFKQFVNSQRDEILMLLGLSFMNRDSTVSQEMIDSVSNIYLETKERTKSNLNNLIIDNPNLYTSALLLNKLSNDRSLEELNSMYSHLSERVKNSYLGKEVKNKLDKMEMLSIGQIAPDFELETLDNNTLKLSSLKGNVVLIDFWASWCGPCIQEIPNVKKVYDEYHDKGFEILSISLDEDKDKWNNAVEKYDLNWQHISSLQGWKCPVVKLYEVSGVPQMILLDREGRIIQKGLRGHELYKEISTLF